MLRFGFAILLASALAACARTAVGVVPVAESSAAAQAEAAKPRTSGEWKIDRQVDRVSGMPSGKAFVVTTRVTARVVRNFTINPVAAVQLECFKDRPVVQIKFSQRVGSNRAASLNYRFDEQPARDAPVRFLADYKTIMIEDKAAVARFVADLGAAARLNVRVDSMVDGTTRTEFAVHDAELAIEAAYAGCPLSPGRVTAAR